MDYRSVYVEVQSYIDTYNIQYPLTVEYMLNFLKYLNINVVPYSQIANYFGCDISLIEYVMESKTGCYKESTIFYNDTNDEYGILFTLCHELFHSVIDMTLSKDDKEKACNCFARNFINPIPKMERISIDEIKRFANYSATGLQVRIDLLKLDIYHFEHILNVTYIPTTNNEFIMMPNAI